MPLFSWPKNKVMPQGNVIYGYDGTDAFPLKANTTSASSTTASLAGLTPDKTIETELLAAQSVAASTNVLSSVLSLAGVKTVAIFIDHGRASSAAFGTNGTEYRIEASQQASGNDTWRALTTITCASTACLALAASADVAAAGTTVVITSGTAPSLGDIVFWANTVAASSSEWMRVRSVSGTANFVILDGLRYGQDSDTNIFTQAEQFTRNVDVRTLTRLRVVVNNNASGTTQAIYSRVATITEK